jgi:hypothetical protein
MKSYSDDMPSTKQLNDTVQSAKNELNITVNEAKIELQEIINKNNEIFRKRVFKETMLNVLSLISILGIIGWLIYKTMS